jgi:hypothetical protein
MEEGGIVDMQGTFDSIPSTHTERREERREGGKKDTSMSASAAVIATPLAVAQMLDGMYGDDDDNHDNVAKKRGFPSRTTPSSSSSRRCRGAVQGQKLLAKMGLDLQRAKASERERKHRGNNIRPPLTIVHHEDGDNNDEEEEEEEKDNNEGEERRGQEKGQIINNNNNNNNNNFGAIDQDGIEYDSDHSDDSDDQGRAQAAGQQWVPVRIAIPKDRDAYISMRLDKKYARYVAGAAHLPNLGSVWGYRDGSMMNFKDSVQLRQSAEGLIKRTINKVARNEFQVCFFSFVFVFVFVCMHIDFSKLFQQTQNQAQQHLNNVNNVLAYANNGMPLASVLTQAAKDAIEQFDQTWVRKKDVGLVHEIMHAEEQVWQIIQRSGCLKRLDASLKNAGSARDMHRIRLLRRHELTMPAFGAAVGAVHAYSLASRPLTRTSKHLLQRANVDCACQMQALCELLGRTEGVLLQCVIGKDEYKPYYFTGYN